MNRRNRVHPADVLNDFNVVESSLLELQELCGLLRDVSYILYFVAVSRIP